MRKAATGSEDFSPIKPLIVFLIIFLSAYLASKLDVPNVEVAAPLSASADWTMAGDIKLTTHNRDTEYYLPANLAYWVPAARKSHGHASLESPTFALPEELALFVMGYPNRSDTVIGFVHQQSDAILGLPLTANNGPNWTLVKHRIPAQWIGEPVRMILKTKQGKRRGSVGISAPFQYEATYGLTKTCKELGSFVLAFILLFIPAVVFGFILYRRLALEPAFFPVICIAALLILSYAGFWLSFINVLFGQTYYSLIYLSSCIGLLVYWLRSTAFRQTLVGAAYSDFAMIFALGLCLFSLLLWIDSHPFRLSFYRFSETMPVDAMLPFQFANALLRDVLLHGFGAWRFSDRPPLQAAVALFLPGTVNLQQTSLLLYQASGVILQTLWLPALLLLMRLISIPRQTQAFTLLSCVFSYFVLLHSIYVWPKLLAGALGIVVVAFLLRPTLAGRRHNVQEALLLGLFTALSLLGHGGNIFLFAPCFLLMLSSKRFPGWHATLIFALSFFCLYAPWLLYQSFYDSPGNALLKIHLAGAQIGDARPLLDMLIENYRQLGWQQWLAIKAQSLRDMALLRFFPDLITSSLSALQTQSLAAFVEFRTATLYSPFMSLGLLQLGLWLALPLWLIKRNDRVQTTWALRFISLALCSMAFWLLLILRDHSAHIMPFASMLLLLLGSALIIGQAPLILQAVFLLVQLAVFIGCYFTAIDDLDGNISAIAYESLNPFALGLTLFSTMAFVFLMLHLFRNADAEHYYQVKTLTRPQPR